MQREVFASIFSVKDHSMVKKGTFELKEAAKGARCEPDVLEQLFCKISVTVVAN